MPELPEVEVTRQALEPYVSATTIKAITIHHCGLRYALDKQKMHNYLLNNCIRQICRRSKYLIFCLPHQRFMLSHLGMTGHWKLCNIEEPLLKHDHLQLALSNGYELRYHDVRRFGFVDFYQVISSTIVFCSI